MAFRSLQFEGVGMEFASQEGKRFFVSLVLSFCILLGGMVWTWRIGGECSKMVHRLAHEQEELEGRRRVASSSVHQELRKQ